MGPPTALTIPETSAQRYQRIQDATRNHPRRAIGTGNAKTVTVVRIHVAPLATMVQSRRVKNATTIVK
jgi:hypothetical protein